jgi:hypothetical protein
MTESIKLVRAFMASPGGLEDERRAARAAAEEVNSTVARRLGYRLELVGWEDTISGVGRPQAIINEELESCELFLGALWTRWGTRPSLAGPYTSGFEEEFELSRRRSLGTGSPAMAMFFKKVSGQQLEDPGPELERVLSFRQRLIDGKELLFQDFVTAEDFAQRVRAFLTSHILERFRQDLAAEARSLEGAAAAAARPNMELASGSAIVTAEESRFLASLAERLDNERTPPAHEIARLRLVGTAIARSGNDEIRLGAHDANLLYAHRSEWKLAPREVWALAAASLAHFAGENLPLWTWIAKLEIGDAHPLLGFTLVGREIERVGAFKALRLIAQPPSEDARPRSHVELVARWLDPQTPDAVKVAALGYLRDVGTIEDVGAITTEMERGASTTATAAIEAIISIKTRNDAQDAARSLLSSSFEKLDSNVLNPALVSMERLTSVELQVGLDHRSPKVRAKTIAILAKRRDLDVAVLERAAEDSSPIVRLASIRAMDRIGVNLGLEKASSILRRSSPGPYGGLFGIGVRTDPEGERLFSTYRRKRFTRMNISELRATATSNNDAREEAWLALVRRSFKDNADTLRNHVDDAFVTYLNERWPQGFPEKPLRGFSLLFGTPRTPEEEKRRELMQESVEILAERGHEIDLDRIRRAVDASELKTSAPIIEYFQRRGGWDDIRRLANPPPPAVFALDTDQVDEHARELAVTAILKLSSNRTKDIVKIEASPPILSQIIKRLPDRAFQSLEDGDVLELLNNPDAAVRAAASRKCIRAWPKARTLALFRRYIEGEQQYYNVVHWLDLAVAYPREKARHIARM